MNTPHLTLSLMSDTLAICRLSSGEPVPSWATQGEFYSVTRTPEELSIVCGEANVPTDTVCEVDWRCLKAEGPFDFSLTGILSSLTEPLARAGISLFALSTYDTDYLLVKSGVLNQVIEVLTSAGHQVRVE